MTLLQSGITKSLAADAYTIDQSLRFNAGDTPFLTRTPGSSGSQTNWTLSVWIKRTLEGGGSTFFSVAHSNTANPFMLIQFSGNKLRFSEYSNDTTEKCSYETTQVFRDPASWMHCVFAVDTTDGTPADRLKVYVNGEQVTSFSSQVTYSSSYATVVNSTAPMYIGKYMPYGNQPLEDYLAEYYFIDGTTYDADDFGETDSDTNQWVPKDASGLTFGTNGFFIDFRDSADLGDDESGNGNDFTVTNLVATDQMKDSPTNNFATLIGKLLIAWGTSNSYSEGNLKFTSGSSEWNADAASISVTSGKWYWEQYQGTSGANQMGIVASTNTSWFGSQVADPQDNSSILYYGADGNKRIDGTSTSYGATYTAGDIIGVALDLDSGTQTVTFYKNNATQGAITLTGACAAAGVRIIPGCVLYGSVYVVDNFGQDSSFAGNATAQGNADSNGVGDFYYEPQTDYLALCSSNLSDPEIKLPGDNFNTVLYTGDGATTLAVTGVGFAPDFTWIKNRSAADKHVLVDEVRGATNYLSSDSTAAEVDDSTFVASLDSDGFTVGDDVVVNTNTENYVSWNWLAADTFDPKTAGDIAAASGRSNATAGFSIVRYTGEDAVNTIGHGLATAPKLVIVKNLGVIQWPVYYLGANGSDGVLFLDQTGSGSLPAGTAYWNDTNPTASVFTVAQSGNTGGLTTPDYIAYCFAEVEGYSKVGFYTGNNSADGTYVYTGFRPAFVMWKVTSASDSWAIMDDKMNTYNPEDTHLRPNAADAASTDTAKAVDYLSNGFKIRTNDGQWNTGSGTYLYYAVAAYPFKYAPAR